MAVCNKCGRDVPRNSGIYKTVKTGSYTGGSGYQHDTTSTIVITGTGLLFIPPLLMIFFRQKYPR